MVSDLELKYKEKKKNMKFAINLEAEREALDDIDNKAEMMDEQEIDEVDLNEYQIGNRATLGQKPGSTKKVGQRKTTIGNSRTAEDFMSRFEKEKQIE